MATQSWQRPGLGKVLKPTGVQRLCGWNPWLPPTHGADGHLLHDLTIQHSARPYTLAHYLVLQHAAVAITTVVPVVAIATYDCYDGQFSYFQIAKVHNEGLKSHIPTHRTAQ